MQRLNIEMAFLVLALVICGASSVGAQATVDGKSKPVASNSADSNSQKSTQRQLAQRTNQNEPKTADNKQPQNKNKKPEAKSKKDGKADKPTPPPVSQERRAELMEFVKANHPELQPLLNQLKSKRQKRFQAVLLELDRDVQRLQWLKKKSQSRYKLELELWVISSRVQLLTAQLSLRKSEKEKASILGKIRKLFEKEHEIKRENTLIALEAAKKKHERFKEQLKNHDANRDSEIARKLAEIERLSSQHKKKPGKKNTEKNSGDKGKPAKGDAKKKQHSAEVTKPKRKTVLTNDGRLYEGIVVSEDKQFLVLKNPDEPTPIKIPKDDIEAVRNAKPTEKEKPTRKVEPVQDPKPVQQAKPVEKPTNSPKEEKDKSPK